MPLKDELLPRVSHLPPEGWTLGHVTIQGRDDGDAEPIEALRHGSFAVHEIVGGDDNYWRVSHAPSGLRIWEFRKIKDAIALAERIEAFTDWNAIKGVMPRGSELYPKVRAVIDEIRLATD
jgi:hypothetical protein